MCGECIATAAPIPLEHKAFCIIDMITRMRNSVWLEERYMCIAMLNMIEYTFPEDLYV